MCVCVSQFVAERSAILLFLIIKLTQETRRRVWRGRDMDGEIGKGQIGEGIDLSLFKPNLIRMNVHSATCSCSVELNKQG